MLGPSNGFSTYALKLMLEEQIAATSAPVYYVLQYPANRDALAAVIRGTHPSLVVGVDVRRQFEARD